MNKINWNNVLSIVLVIIVLALFIMSFVKQRYSEDDLNKAKAENYDSGYLKAFSDVIAGNFTTFCVKVSSYGASEIYDKYCNEKNCVYFVAFKTNRTGVYEKKYNFYYPQISPYCIGMEEWCLNNNQSYIENTYKECSIMVG